MLSLENAVKELLENSLDAGASIIEVRIKDNGLDTVQVIDNGSGILEADWASMALKYHTSKLVPRVEGASDEATPNGGVGGSAPDLASVTTFGFRGEALSSLCALCEKVEVLTCTTDMKGLGRFLEFDKQGQLIEQEKPRTAARQVSLRCSPRLRV